MAQHEKHVGLTMNISVIKNCPNQIFQSREDFCCSSLLVDWPFWSSSCNRDENPVLGLMSQFHWFVVSLLNVEYNKRYQPWADADNMSYCVTAKKSWLWKVQEGLPCWGGQKEKVDYKPEGVEDPFSLETDINWKKPILHTRFYDVNKPDVNADFSPLVMKSFSCEVQW